MYQIAVCIGRKTSYLSNAEDPMNLCHVVFACQPVFVNLFTEANWFGAYSNSSFRFGTLYVGPYCKYRHREIRWMTRKEWFAAGRDLINLQIRYLRARSKCVYVANIDLTAFSAIIFGDSRVKFWSEIRCIPCIFYNREWPLRLTFIYFHQLNVWFLCYNWSTTISNPLWIYPQESGIL